MLNTLKIIGLASLLIVLATCGAGTSSSTTYTNQNNIVTTIAGTAGLNALVDGTGAAARFSYPFGITWAGGNLYVADTYNNAIRKIVIATGAVTTIAGGTQGSADGIGTAASFYYPYGITTDGINLYVTDTNNYTIRQIVIATGVVSTIAGTAGTQGSADGTGTAARFLYPKGITTDGTNLYVADTENSTIRQIVIASGAVTTIAGTAGTQGSADGTGTAARFYWPFGITVAGGNLYVADTYNSTIRKMVIATGVVSTIAGTAGTQGSADGTGTAATFLSPTGITTDGTNLYVTDYGGDTIRQVVIATGVVSTIAGTPGSPGSADGTGAAARFLYPSGIATDGTNLYVADTGNSTIREIY